MTRDNTTQHCHRLAPQNRRPGRRPEGPRSGGPIPPVRYAAGRSILAYPLYPPTLRTEQQLTARADRRVRDPAHTVAFTTAVAIGGARSVHRRTGMLAAHVLPGDSGRPGSPPATNCPQNPPPALAAGVRGHPVVARVPTHNRAQPASHLRDRIVQAPPKLGLHLPQLGLQSLPYCGPVRLPSSVHRRRTSLDFPTRPAAPSATGEAGISRLPRKVFPYVLGVCDRAGSRSASRYRRPGCGLPHPPTASAPQSNSFRGSIPGPHVPLSPVNASPPPSRAAAHDSGPPWVASPSTYDSFIHNNPAGFFRRTGGAK